MQEERDPGRTADDPNPETGPDQMPQPAEEPSRAPGQEEGEPFPPERYEDEAQP